MISFQNRGHPHAQSPLPTPKTIAIIRAIVTDPAIRKRALWFGERYSTPLLAMKLQEIVTGSRPAMGPHSVEDPVDWMAIAAGIRLAAMNQARIAPRSLRNERDLKAGILDLLSDQGSCVNNGLLEQIGDLVDAFGAQGIDIFLVRRR